MNSNVTDFRPLKAAALQGGARHSGLECVGPLHWGAHICLMYASQDELLEILVPYFREGLLSNEYCLWITSRTLTPERAADALRAALPDLDQYLSNGQIEILDDTEWYTRGGVFNAARVSEGWFDKLHLALERGFDGLRLSGDTAWLAQEDWDAFVQYEAVLDPAIKQQRILALCTYALEKLRKQELFDVVANHEFALIRERGAWTTFKCYARCRNEQVVRESEARLRATIDGASDGIVTCDGAGAIVLANLTAQCIFNCPPFELIGSNIGDFVPDLAKAMRGGLDLRPHAIFSGEARRKDGSAFPVEWTLSVVTADNQPLFVGFVRDLTQRRAAEAQIRKLHADRVGAIGGMATALAHELNQPLTAAASYLQAAQRLLRMPEHARPARVENAVDRAAEQALRAGKIISHIREFVTRRDPDKTIWDLHDLVQDACELTNQSARQIGVDLKCDFSAAKQRVLADRIQIEQVMANLIRNAVEAVQNAEMREVTIATSCAGDAVQIDVIDTGAGFPEEIKADLFEPFVTSKAHGLGVGLSVSRAIIEAHDGRIWARPNPDGGSIVSFTLPAA
ncbi:MEDS domain-containing protein [Methylocystis sp. JAN1]|uniref:MEDS domain-containing protein n=1 Tax=Methylocystis sp. JAN1 TaxID=3397211 RepID=UPI003FA2E8EC